MFITDCTMLTIKEEHLLVPPQILENIVEFKSRKRDAKFQPIPEGNKFSLCRFDAHCSVRCACSWEGSLFLCIKFPWKSWEEKKRFPELPLVALHVLPIFVLLYRKNVSETSHLPCTAEVRGSCWWWKLHGSLVCRQSLLSWNYLTYSFRNVQLPAHEILRQCWSIWVELTILNFVTLNEGRC